MIILVVVKLPNVMPDEIIHNTTKIPSQTQVLVYDVHTNMEGIKRTHCIL